MNRFTGMLFALAVPLLGLAQGGDLQLRAKADALFAEGRFAEAYPLYSQLVSLTPSDRELNYRFGACTLYGGDDKEKAIGHLKYAVEGPSAPPLAWYFLGRSYHVSYRFKEALVAYERYKGTADKKTLTQYPADALEQQCRNGQQLLSNLKDIEVHSKLEVEAAEFFRFYDLAGIGGRIVVTPDELRSSLDKKSDFRSLIYLPEKPGPIYFSSLGKDGRTGKDIYRTELLATGQFAEPQKLAGYVNTDQDEDHPFLSADGRYFYFASKGHNSMGGYDVFRASYDKGLDVFGAPENLDFAVNTPDDDILYMVDAEGKQACFASGRSSHQGMLHVYRVSTAQTPVNITVLKGTYASQYDANDRKAHLVVEDALTREKVADVRTDQNGNYVLALPRSGRYRFVVEAGPSGRTHVGQVEVPRSDSPKAYRQEMSLVDQAGQEKLMIRNYFEEPLAEDLIALALEEIKRRAALDVTGSRPEVPAPAAEPAPVADVMTAAGFTGDVSKEQAVQLAKDDARALEQETEQLQAMSAEAFRIAEANAAESDRLGTEAASLVAQASAATDEQQRNGLMAQAARTRQFANEARQRSQAALGAARSLDTRRMATATAAQNAQRLSTELTAAIGANDRDRTVAQLSALKARMDVKNGPDGGIDAREEARRSATQAAQDADKVLQRSQSVSNEETELVERIDRLKREQADAGRARKEELGREITTLEEQLGYLREEKMQAVGKARAAQQQAAIAQGQATLVAALAEGTRTAAPAPDAARMAALEGTLGKNAQRMQDLAIDERYDAAVAVERAGSAQHTFDWKLQGDGPATAQGNMPTQTGTGQRVDGEMMAANTVTMEAPAAGDRTLNTAQVPPANTGEVPVSEVRGEEGGGRPPTQHAEGAPAVTTAVVVATAVAANAASNGEQQGEGRPPVQEEQPPAGEIAVAEPVPSRTEEELVSMRGAGQVDTSSASEPPVDEASFMAANELAELKQLRNAEKNRARRDSLDQRIAAIEKGMQADDRPAVVEQASDRDEEPVTGTARAFEASIASPQLDALLVPDHAADVQRIAEGTLAPADKAVVLHGLELVVVDSIEAETARQLALLDTDPTLATEVLPRVERLRQLKEEHVKRADEILAASQQQYVAQESRTMEQQAQAAVDAQATPSAQPVVVQAGQGGGTTHVDRYVSVSPSTEFVYESVVEHRNPAVAEAVAEKDRDLMRIADLGDRIDSLEDVLEEMPKGREYDKLRTQADRMIDEEVILRTELGQRMAYISREEMRLAEDSLREVGSLVTARGIAADEPLVLLAEEFRKEAAAQTQEAATKRKQADRSEDILERDRLYREAYEAELQALRSMDQAITVKNHLLGADHVAGERLTYAEVEQRMFASAEAAPMADGNAAGTVAPKGLVETGVRVVPTTDTTGTDPATMPANMALYQRFLSEDEPALKPSELITVDASAIALESSQARQQASALEQRSNELGDRAIALRDSAATARKRDREQLETEALRAQQLSDSLHQASLAMEQRAQVLDQRQREVEEARAFNERLKKFYYLGGEEQLVVMNEADHSRYFMARSLSLEQQQRAMADGEEALAGRQLSDTLVAQAARLLAEPDRADGSLSPERMAQAQRLNERAVELHDRSDSLSASAERLKSAADLNDRQATLLLQGMATDRSTEVMALEQRTRRVDPLIARSRALIAQVDSIKAREAALAQQQGGAPAGAAPANAAQAPAGAVAQEAVRPPAGAPGTDVAAVTRPTEPVVPAATERAVPDPVAPAPGAFVAPEVLTTDIFGFKEAGAAPAPIAKDQPMPKGVVFKVQVGAFKNDIPQELFSDMMPVMGETTASGVTRYTAGLFNTPEAAEKARALVRERGYRDAFVVAYIDGGRVPMTQAVKAMAPLPGAVAAAQPEPATRPAAVIQAPATAVAAPDDAQVLATYPPTAEELLGQFAPPADATAYYNDPTAAPARQVETVKGLFFTVQVGVYSKPTALDKLFNITPLNSERTETGKIRYTTGVFLDLDKARTRKDEAVGLGVKDAFITAYLNGKRIPMRDARALLQKFGPSVLADPSIATR
ncbi:MAG: PD40 domain-containing protein [Flavobacteriales bacterium]|nr:PD40 domain-containing protein [Flavobacteriales bacterium]